MSLYEQVILRKQGAFPKRSPSRSKLPRLCGCQESANERFSISELSTKKIAQNNLLLSNTQSNPYILHKQFHETPESTGSDRLFSFQNRAFTDNARSVDLLVHKYDGVAKSTAKALSRHSTPTTSPDINILSVFNVAARARGQTGKTGIKDILPLLEQRPQDIGLTLTAVQLHIANGNVSSAISTLESLFRRLDESISESDHEIRFNPGLVSTLVGLYKRQGRKKHIRLELAKAAKFWQQSPTQSPSLLRAAAASLLQSPNPSDITTAGEIFTRLHKIDPTDRVATAGYVASYALTDAEKVQSEVDKLSSVENLTSGIDVSSLEAAGIPSITPTATTNNISTLQRKRGAEDKAEDQNKKRVRTSRLPKDYDANKKPDSERWLPLRDRSSYRPKGKKAKQRAADRTQGGVVNEKSGETSSNAPVVQQKAQGGGNSSKKKKGKGKK